MTDGRRPHQFPQPFDPETDILAWKCKACGEWVREYGPEVVTLCPDRLAAFVYGQKMGSKLVEFAPGSDMYEQFHDRFTQLERDQVFDELGIQPLTIFASKA